LVQKLDQKWLADIEARGEATGKIEGKREMLRIILRSRFGAVSEAVEQRIAAADADQLDALASRAAIVASPDEL
jgi:hypothetical protein